MKLLSQSSSVLLGGRPALRFRTFLAHVAFVWLPVLVMLLLIARESTASLGSVKTSPILRPIYEALFGPITDNSWEITHHYIRKTGHFLGYGTLGVTWLRGFLLEWLPQFQCRAAAVWRRWCLQMAICCTALVASLDEVHQSYIPDRTGLVTDVLLDTCGATVLCMIFVLGWNVHNRRDRRTESA